MRLRTLIVDDEPVARKILREELELVDDVEIVAEADSGAAALEQIARHQPDLVFLDLHMPAMGGLDVVRRLKRGTHIPVIVIVTAYDQFAIQAFEAGAIDYLLKPVGQERLAEAVERARRLTARDAVERVAELQEIAEPAAAQRAKKVVAAFQGLTAGCGTFEVQGSTITMRQEAGANPGAVGTSSKWEYKLDGKKLRLQPLATQGVEFQFEKLP